VAGLLGDDALGDAGSSSRGRQAGAQRVSGHLARVESGTDGVALQHERHRRSAESRWPDAAVAVHRPEGVSFGDA
jgi:hypothetical protein